MSTEPTITDLTSEQKEVLLRLCNAAEKHRSVTLTWTNKVRETITGAALVRKGLAIEHPARVGHPRRFACTTEGYWLGDSLRIWKRQQR